MCFDNFDENKNHDCHFKSTFNLNLFELGIFELKDTHDLLDSKNIFKSNLINENIPIKNLRDLRNSNAHSTSFKNGKYWVDFDWKNNFINLIPTSSNPPSI